MPIINLDDAKSSPSLIVSPSATAMTVKSDTVVMMTMYSIHTIQVSTQVNLLKIGGVISINGIKGEIVNLVNDYHLKNYVITANFPTTANLPFNSASPIVQYTYNTIIPNYQANADSITYMVQNNLGLYLYLDYVQGAETDIRMYFTLRDSKQVKLGVPTSEYALMTVTDPTGLTVPYNLQVNTSGKYVMPVNIPEPVKYLTVNFAYTGSTSAAGGTLKVFANTDKNYYA